MRRRRRYSLNFLPIHTMNDFRFRLRAGDTVEYHGQPCPVLRVTDCSAVVAVCRPAREFTTLFGKRVQIQPKPALVRISPNSEATILNRRHHEHSSR